MGKNAKNVEEFQYKLARLLLESYEYIFGNVLWCIE